MSEPDSSANLSLDALLGEMEANDTGVKVETGGPVKSEDAQPQPPARPARPKQRRRRLKTPTARAPVYSLGSELSVEERLVRFNRETEEQMADLRGYCETMSKTLQKERDRIRKEPDGDAEQSAPKRRKQDQFVGSIKHKVDTITRRLKTLQDDLTERNQQLRSEYEVEKGRIFVEREQLDKTSMHWCQAGGLITTPHQRRLQEAAAAAEDNARCVLQYKRKSDEVG